MTHLYSSCRSACLSATWRFRDALLHSTLPHSWQVNNFFADWVFREFKVSPVIEVSTETQQRTSHAAAHPYNTLKPYTTTAKEKKRSAAYANLARMLLSVVVLVFSRLCLRDLDYGSFCSSKTIDAYLFKARIFRDRSEQSSVHHDDQYLAAST